MIAIGIDYGEARIGVAASDALGMLAHPVETVPAQPRAAALSRIAAIVQQRKAECLVMGLPIREDGTEGTTAAKVRRFATSLATQLPSGFPIEFQDEYGSTKSAADQLRAAGWRTHRHRPVLDQAAAVVILQDWLEAAAARQAKPQTPAAEEMSEDQ